MAGLEGWNPFGVSLNIYASGSNVKRKSKTEYTVDIAASWGMYHAGNSTNYGMDASSGGQTKTLNSEDNYSSGSSGSFTGTYSISANDSGTKQISVTFRNYNSYWGHSATKTLTFDVTVPAYPSYTVSYDANGGTGEPASHKKWHDEGTTLWDSGYNPTRTGYIFVTWNTKADGTGTNYAPGAAYTENANVTFYAQWKRIEYTIKYDANGGSLGSVPASQTKKWGIDLMLSSGTPTYEGYNFKGWNTAKDGTGTAYASGATYKANQAAILYAQWQEKTYTVTYNANGGSLGSVPATQTKKHFDNNFKLSTNSPTRDKYNFVGWSTVKNTGEATSDDADYQPGQAYKDNKNITLYALWSLAYIAPTVNITEVRRCLQNGAFKEDGKYIKVSFTWSVDTTIDSANIANDIKIEYKTVEATLWKVAYTENPAKASGVESIVVGKGDILPEKTYDIKVIVSDEGGSREEHMSMQQQFRTLDFGNEGNTVALGKIASNEKGVEFGAASRFVGIGIYKDIAMQDYDEIKGFIIDQGYKIIRNSGESICYWRYEKYDDGTVQLWGDMMIDSFVIDTPYNGWYKGTAPRFVFPFEVTDINAFPSIGSVADAMFTTSVSKLATDGCYIVVGSPTSYKGVAHITVYIEGLVV